VKNLLKKYGHIWVLGYALIYLPWFHYLEVNVKGDYAIMHVTLDDLIPFNEYFVVPYVLWFVYMFVAFWYFFFTSKQEFYRMCTFLIAGMTISLLICTFFPNGTDLRVEVDPKKNVFCWLVHLIHRADTATNVFPSIHAYNSIGVHSAVMNSRSLKNKPIVRRASFLLMITICLSTVFLKQHSVADVLGATILSLFMYSLVYGSEFAENRRTVRAKTTGWG
jgi:membrane-associated phospholipid phosphatase